MIGSDFLNAVIFAENLSAIVLNGGVGRIYGFSCLRGRHSRPAAVWDRAGRVTPCNLSTRCSSLALNGQSLLGSRVG
jgi:hypothetical protein